MVGHADRFFPSENALLHAGVHWLRRLKLGLFGFASIGSQGTLFLHNPLSKMSLPEFCPAGKLALFCKIGGAICRGSSTKIEQVRLYPDSLLSWLPAPCHADRLVSLFCLAFSVFCHLSSVFCILYPTLFVKCILYNIACYMSSEIFSRSSIIDVGLT